MAGRWWNRHQPRSVPSPAHPAVATLNDIDGGGGGGGVITATDPFGPLNLLLTTMERQCGWVETDRFKSSTLRMVIEGKAVGSPDPITIIISVPCFMLPAILELMHNGYEHWLRYHYDDDTEAN